MLLCYACGTVVIILLRILQSYPEIMAGEGEAVVIHTARFLPAGLHLYDIISGITCNNMKGMWVWLGQHGSY